METLPLNQLPNSVDPIQFQHTKMPWDTTYRGDVCDHNILNIALSKEKIIKGAHRGLLILTKQTHWQNHFLQKLTGCHVSHAYKFHFVGGIFCQGLHPSTWLLLDHSLSLWPDLYGKLHAMLLVSYFYSLFVRNRRKKKCRGPLIIVPLRLASCLDYHHLFFESHYYHLLDTSCVRTIACMVFWFILDFLFHCMLVSYFHSHFVRNRRKKQCRGTPIIVPLWLAYCLDYHHLFSESHYYHLLEYLYTVACIVFYFILDL